MYRIILLRPFSAIATILLLASLAFPCVVRAETYYVDSLGGADANAGTSESNAWRTLARVNEQTFKPGDRVLFKAGCTWSGQFKPQGSGALIEGIAAPIVFDRYGEGDAPRIDGQGVMPATVYLYNMEYVELRNLEVTNKGEQPKPRRRGVMVHAKDFGTVHHVKLIGLNIHDVNGSVVKKEGGGSAIIWQNEGSEKPTRFDGLLIEGCRLADCTRNGINSRGYTRRDETWHPSLNVVIRKNLLEGIPGDGIVPIGCDGALIEHNIMRDCPRLLKKGDAAAGIWPWSSDNTVIQFNEVSDHKAPWDAQGFDSDWNCRNTLIQYNYSHDNEGGFLLICNNGEVEMPRSVGNIGTVVRYNISINDGLREEPTWKGPFSPTFHISGPCKDTSIYNNLIVITKKPSEEIDRTLVCMDNWGGPWPEDTVFRNNIFFTEDETSYVHGKAIRTLFESNMYVGRHKKAPEDEKAIRLDTLFEGIDFSTLTRETLLQLRPKADSLAVGAGMPIEDNGRRDLSGTPIPTDRNPSLGALEPVDILDDARNTGDR